MTIWWSSKNTIQSSHKFKWNRMTFLIKKIIIKLDTPIKRLRGNTDKKVQSN